MSVQRKIALVWRWSAVATLPVVVVFASWAYATWARYRTFALGYDAAPIVMRLHAIGAEQWQACVRRAGQSVSTRTLSDVPEALALPSLQLFIGGDKLARLDRDLPYSGFEFCKGQLMFPDGLREVSVRYRGDFAVHWAYDKKSIRVKTDTSELFAGMRVFNLVVPKFEEQVNNYLGYWLAKRMGLISPRSELVNVSINGRNEGLFEFTEQLEEGTLRRHDRMPGDIYAGELIGKTAMTGTSNRVFDLPRLWEKAAVNNHYEADARAPLDLLTRLLDADPSEEVHAQLSRLLDMEKFGALGAYEVLTQTLHYDEYHNWRLFWDPWACKLEPVVWDPTPWFLDVRPRDGEAIALDRAESRLQLWLHRNGDFLAARAAVLRDFYASGGDAELLRQADWAIAAARAALAVDPNARPSHPRVVEAAMQSFRAFVVRVLHDVRVAYLEVPGRVRCRLPDRDGVMALEVSGRTSVDALVLRFRQPLAQRPGAKVRVRRGGAWATYDLDGGVSVDGDRVRVPARLLAQLAPRYSYYPDQLQRQREFDEVPGYYEVVLAGLAADDAITSVGVERGGRVDRPEVVAALAARDLPWVYRPMVERPSRPVQVWRGEVVVDGVRDVAADVVIEPGTVVRMHPDASVLFRGRVIAAGTQSQPIVVVPARDGQAPWGTFSINGSACSGSTFRYCRLRGGSGYKVPLEEYTAMFSVHNCRDVLVEDCDFADNFVVDDMVHVMYSEVTFERCALLRARADALDCDISKIVVRDCRFVDSDNDGVDLMTTQAVVLDSQFLRNRDKGISIGEATQLIVLHSTFDGCVRAMEAKDGSVARAFNCEIVNCQRALNAYRKNWRYDAGGDLLVAKSVFANNQEMPTADPRSRLLLRDCRIDKDLTPTYREGERVLQNHATTDRCDGASAPRDVGRVPFPVELPELHWAARDVWSTMRADVRGRAHDG